MKVNIFTVLAALASIAAFPRPGAPSQPGEIKQVIGRAYLNGERLDPSALTFPNITENSLMRTEGGRVEVLLAPGVTLRLGEGSTLRVLTNQPNDTRIEVLGGSALVLTDQNAKVTVVCEDIVALSTAGAYRFDNRRYEKINENFCLFKVYRGTAEVQLSSVRASLGPGRMMDLNRECADHIPVNKFDVDGELKWQAEDLRRILSK
jgi:ferric-dicitrate binding protein FerR (iron transport regulator)